MQASPSNSVISNETLQCSSLEPHNNTLLGKIKNTAGTFRTKIQGFLPLSCCCASRVLADGVAVHEHLLDPSDLQAEAGLNHQGRTDTPFLPRWSSQTGGGIESLLFSRELKPFVHQQQPFDGRSLGASPIQFTHHLITHGSTTRTGNNPTGRMSMTYSDNKRASVISAGARARFHQGAKVVEHVTKQSQVFKHMHGSLQVVSQNPNLAPVCFAGDLHVSNPGVEVRNFNDFIADMKALAARLSSHPPSRLSSLAKSEQTIVKNAVLDFMKHLMPGGNPALASDIQRFALLLMDLEAMSSTKDQVSVYCDHDTSSDHINKSMLAPFRFEVAHVGREVDPRLMSQLQDELPELYGYLETLRDHGIQSRPKNSDSQPPVLSSLYRWALAKARLHHNEIANGVDRRLTTHAQKVEQASITLAKSMRENDNKSDNQVRARDYLAFTHLPHSTIPRDINQLSLLNPKTPPKTAVVREFILEKLDAIHERINDVNARFAGRDRLVTAHTTRFERHVSKPASASLFDITASLMSGEPLLGKTVRGKLKGRHPPLSQIEARHHFEVTRAFFGSDTPFCKPSFRLSIPNNKVWIEAVDGDFEGSWRSTSSAPSPKRDQSSATTFDVSDHLWSAYAL